jgi:CubicO group peptidase (beta-lactamase class C family)
MKKIFSVLLLSFLSLPNITAQSIPPFVKDSLDVYVKRGLENWQIPGVAVLIVKDGQIIVEKGYGVKELGTIDKVDKNTLFMIGSNTKAFTGTLLAMLEDEGKCKPEDSVIDYIPNFNMKDSWITKHLNLADIVSHRIGMETFQGDFMYWTSNLTADECIEKFGKLTPIYDFRTKYGYTNLGFVIAGKVIQKITGLSWDENLKQRIFDPLEMNRTLALSKDYLNAENTAKPHTLVDGKMSEIPVPMIDNLSPAGSIGSSINDLSHWVMAQLDSGKYNDSTIIPFSVIQRTREPLSIQRRVRHPYNKTHYILYGMGWALQDYEGREIVLHTGGVNGFVTSVTLVPEEKFGIVVLTNTDQNAFFQSLKWEILDSYLGLPYRNYDSTYYAMIKLTRAKEDKWLKEMRDSVLMDLTPVLSLKDFEGKYKNEAYGFLKIKQNDNYLEMSFEHHPDLIGKLESLGDNRFLCTYNDPTFGIKVIPFNIIDNKVKSLTLYVAVFVERTPYEFIKE